MYLLAKQMDPKWPTYLNAWGLFHSLHLCLLMWECCEIWDQCPIISSVVETVVGAAVVGAAVVGAAVVLAAVVGGAVEFGAFVAL